jgi:hypothetical protein
VKRALAALALLLPALAGAQMTVWTATSLEKIRPSTPARALAPVELDAAGNEWVSFQVVVDAGSRAVTSVDSSVASITTPPGGVCPPPCTPIDTEAIVYRELPYNVVNISDPRGSVGSWPDALIPRVDPYFRESRNAFPLNVAPGSREALWYDLYVPSGLAPGTWGGSLSITATSEAPVEIPIHLRVRNFNLPSTPSLPSLYGYDEFAAMVAHDPVNRFDYDWQRILSELTVPYLKMLVRHRIGIDYDSQDGTDSAFDNTFPNPFHWELFDASVGAALDGTLPDTHGNRLAAIDLPDIEGGRFSDADKIVIWSQWASHFRANGWFSRLYDYPGICDEPDPTDVSRTSAIRSHAQQLHTADTGFRLTSTTAIRYPVTPFSQADSPLIGYVDVWVPNVINYSLKNPEQCADPADEVPREDYDAAVAGGDEVWAYQSCNSHGSCDDGTAGTDCALNYPTFMVDAPATHNRIMSWMTWRQRATGELYFALNFADSARSAAEEYGNIYDFGGNGDGTLIYPGTPEIVGGTTHIPIESIRLKEIRDSEQDFEYFTLLAQRGMRAQADAIVAGLVTNDYTFDDRPEALLVARSMAADLLDGAIVPIGVVPIAPPLPAVVSGR